jgi:hypothetical protein
VEIGGSWFETSSGKSVCEKIKLKKTGEGAGDSSDRVLGSQVQGPEFKTLALQKKKKEFHL